MCKTIRVAPKLRQVQPSVITLSPNVRPEDVWTSQGAGVARILSLPKPEIMKCSFIIIRPNYGAIDALSPKNAEN